VAPLVLIIYRAIESIQSRMTCSSFCQKTKVFVLLPIRHIILIIWFAID